MTSQLPPSLHIYQLSLSILLEQVLSFLPNSFIYLLLVWIHHFPFLQCLIFITIPIILMLELSQIQQMGASSSWSLCPCDMHFAFWYKILQAHLAATMPQFCNQSFL